MPNHSAYAKIIHEANVKAGWWTDLLTGESIIETRNIGELISLIHSELDEAWEGAITNKSDDHLPKYLMFDVELADTVIRIYDLLGSRKIDPADIPLSTFPINDNIAVSFCWIHYAITQALEGFRQGDQARAAVNLVAALRAVWDLAEKCGIKLESIMLEKLAYNAKRADHKLENRKLKNGKKF